MSTAREQGASPGVRRARGARAGSLSLRTGRFWSLYGVWYRHVQVHRQTIWANALPPILEPLLFFSAIAFGLGPYLPSFEGMPYRAFIASGIIATSAMFTGAFETTFGTFVRLVFQRTYDSMLGTHLEVTEMFTGELLFTATKGLVFSAIVMGVTSAFGVRLNAWCALVPLVGAATGYLFGALGLVVCSYVKTINNFNFFLSGVISPMFFFSGTFFPIRGIHPALDVISQIVPLTHAVELSRALYRGAFETSHLWNLGVLALYTVVLHLLAIGRMRRRVVG
jgi:lipooligosaccharide transport system permease protein